MRFVIELIFFLGVIVLPTGTVENHGHQSHAGEGREDHRRSRGSGRGGHRPETALAAAAAAE